MLLLQKKERKKEIWPSFFTKIRQWLPSDCAADRLAWISITNLPISGWNMACLTKWLQDMGRLIGYDKISLRFSSLYAIGLLIGTQNSDSLHSEVMLRLNGDDYRITISDTDFLPSLPYPDSDSIPYSIDTFFGNTETG
jgi:hypothetical protein